MLKRVPILVPESRPDIKFRPQWEGVIEGYVVNTCTKNEWRVLPEYDFDDLYQEAFMKFLSLCERYPRVVDGAHFMGLMRSALWNHITVLARKRTKRKEISFWENTDDADRPLPLRHKYTHTPVRDHSFNEVDVADMKENAPPEVASLIKACEDGDGEPVKFLRNRRVRETTNSYLCRRANVAPTPVLRHQLESLMAGERMALA